MLPNSETGEPSSNNILVHCFAGKSRSTSMVVGYLMGRKGLTLKEALDLIREKRPIAEPNPGFIIQLKAYEKMLYGKLSDGVPVVFPKKTETNGAAKEILDSIEEMREKGDTAGVAELQSKLKEAGIEESDNAPSEESAE